MTAPDVSVALPKMEPIPWAWTELAESKRMAVARAILWTVHKVNVPSSRNMIPDHGTIG
jgi:hypothetical protein